MQKLWVSEVGHSHLGFENQIVGRSINVGMRIFNIVTGSSFAADLCRGCGQWLPEVLGPRSLHRLKMPAEL